MVIKLLGFGIKNYFKDAFNSFDCFLIISGIIDLIVFYVTSAKTSKI